VLRIVLGIAHPAMVLVLRIVAQWWGLFFVVVLCHAP